jgi:endonuclease III
MKVSSRLTERYRNPRLHNKSNPLDELIFILLSAKTAERSYLRTYAALRMKFHPWSRILEAPASSVVAVITEGGLAEKKEKQLRALLLAIRERTGEVSLEFLSDLSDEDAESFLVSLPGIGLKSARCVLMYSLHRDVFPVDTHCRRVLSRLGLVEFERLTDSVQNRIQAKIPAGIRHTLHVNLVAHGREVCVSRRPRCGECPISEFCTYFANSRGGNLDRVGTFT